MEPDVHIPQLTDLPSEILQIVFNHLDDVTLLKARQVSRQFKMHTEEGVRTKYSGQIGSNSSYHIDISQNVENDEQHSPFIQSFGSFISAIAVTFNDIQISPDNKMIRLLKQKCSALSIISLKSAFAHVTMDLEGFLYNFERLTTLKLNGLNANEGWERHSYPNLRFIEFRCMHVKMDILRSFFRNNSQVTHFTFGGLAGITIDVVDGTNLEVLCCDERISFGNFFTEDVIFINDMSRVSIPSLFEIAIGNECSKFLFEVIGAGCRHLQTFTVYQIIHAVELNAIQLNIICSLQNLLVIKMDGFIFDANQVKHIIRNLPHLIEMQFSLDNPTIDDIKSIVAIVNNHLKLLGINLQNTLDEDQFLGTALHFWFNQNVVNDLKLHLKLQSGKIIVTKEKLMKNGDLMHWIGLSNEISSSNVDLMSFEDKCLEKIVDYLDFKAKLAFYQTCNKMKQIIQPKLQQQSICIYQNSSILTEYLRLFGKFVSQIIADLSPTNDTRLVCKMIYEYACDLNELILKGDSANFIHHLIENRIVLPNMTALQIAWCHLDLSSQEQLDFGTVFNHLTTLRFDHYNESVLKFLRALNETVCHNLHELSIMSIKDKIPHPKHQFASRDYQLNNAIINTIVRFHNITALHLFMRNEYEANTKYLFEHCSNLISVSIVYDGCDDKTLSTYDRYITPYLRDLKRACIKLETLNLALLEHNPELFPGGIFAYNQLLREVRKLFPFITIKIVAAKNIGQCFDLTNQWLTDFARAKCIFN